MALRLYTPLEIADILKRSRITVYRYIRQGKIPVLTHRGRFGRKEYYIWEDDVIAFIISYFASDPLRLLGGWKIYRE